MRRFCLSAIFRLSVCRKDWGKLFVNLRMEFHRRHGHGLITSTSVGADFFETLIDCIDGKEHDEKGEYGNNFRKLVAIGRDEEIDFRG